MPNNPSLMAVSGHNGRFSMSVIDIVSDEMLGETLPLIGSMSSSSTYATANRSIFIPLTLDKRTKFVGAFLLNGGTAAGHWDIGIYTKTLASKLASTGTQAQSGTSTLQTATFSLVLDRGNYFAAFDADSTSLTAARFQPQPRQLRGLGCLELLSTYPLPAGPVTPSAVTDGTIPMFGFYIASTT